MSNNIYISLRADIFDALDATLLSEITADELLLQLSNSVDMLILKKELQVSSSRRLEIVNAMLAELKGYGPLQVLLDNQDVSDILINGPKNVFIEINGKMKKSVVSFVDEQQLLSIAKRIASNVGRRVDESNPLCDARMHDGSRVNIAVSPLAIDGTSISIRKFKKQKIKMDDLVGFGALTPQMAHFLSIACFCKCNIVISGGTGSGKTTLLNALSGYIQGTDRVITIEDAAELQLQKPHVVRLETRPANIEGTGQVTARDLVINSLRMRPDRVIIGECRGGEAFEMLQAMNTGHDGSMTTLHANTPRDAISRVESMVMMATANLPIEAIRRNIISAVDLIIQIKRLHDGSRKVINITEIYGLEGEQVIMEDVFQYKATSVGSENEVVGEFSSMGLNQRSIVFERASYFGLQDKLKALFE
ncbi:pilus assembly protein CpaF [Shewanella sairae]|uniref:Pilus assembly protein CpaF n=1 Tax=Shewanella sairae TaxID=190310 RepID=A0ABQ4PQF9_9GAMM|nr:CpaF family protein [Shewanella sairae]MCL1132461.1 CpaF family protein [Shewanella sairae]GIU51364.1 pilus assembly protein CpaF [Shewanella sairae]